MTPELFGALSDAGQGDRIVLASSNFPSATLARPSESASLIRMDGQTVETVLEEIMKFIKVRCLFEVFKIKRTNGREMFFWDVHVLDEIVIFIKVKYIFDVFKNSTNKGLRNVSLDYT